MLYLRFVFICIWFAIAFGIGFLLSLFRWGDTNLNRFTAGLFGKGALKILGIRLEIDGLEELEKHQPCIYAANHQGSLDIITFGSFYPHKTAVIAKKEIMLIPVLNLYFKAAGNILIDRQKRTSALASLEKALKAIRERGSSVWVFPEGTRNRTNEPILPLKKGAFHMAIAAQVPIVPVVSAPIRGLINMKERHYAGGVLKIKILPPVPTQGLKAADVEQLAQRVRAMMIEAVRGLSA